MNCSACGRVLKNARSQEIGYGPVCYRRLFGSSKQFHKAKEGGGEISNYGIPGQISLEEYLQNLGDEE